MSHRERLQRRFGRNVRSEFVGGRCDNVCFRLSDALLDGGLRQGENIPGVHRRYEADAQTLEVGEEADIR